MERMMKKCILAYMLCMLVLTLNAMNALASNETEMETCDLTAHAFCYRDMLPTQYVKVIAPPNQISFMLLRNDNPGDRNGKIENDADDVTYSVGGMTNYLATLANSEDSTKTLSISNNDAITESPQYWTFYQRPAQVVKLLEVFAAKKK